MANLKESDLWEGGIYQLEEEDPVLGGPDGVDNLPPRQLANRTRYQRLRNVTPWDPGFDYPAGAYVHHAGTTWRSTAPSLNVPPGDKAGRWERWGHNAKELSEALGNILAMHEGKEDPHPLYAFRDSPDRVPDGYVGGVIVVRTPHLRMLAWNGKEYVRAPWNQPGMVLYSYDNPASIPGYLPVRGDVVYNQANYPDLVARLGLSGAGTFSLIELRGEFIRCLDNGRGVDAGRGPRTAQAGDNRWHSHAVADATHSHHVNDPTHAHGAWTDGQGHHDHANGITRAEGPYGLAAAAPYGGAYVNNIAMIGMDGRYRTEGAGGHGHNVGVGGSHTGIWLSASGAGVSLHGDGSEARPRNIALPAWISY